MRRVEYLIIGGGISGLSFANAADGDYLIVEQEERPGGLCRTHYTQGFVWDYAGHFFHFANPEIRRFFESRLSPDEMARCRKNTKIFYDGSLIDYPFQKNIHQLDREDFIDCLYTLYFRKEKERYDDFLDMLYGKFGEGITRRFLRPYNEKLYACDLKELDADAMGRFFPYAELDDIIRNMRQPEDNSYNLWFDYPKAGSQKIVDILLEKISDERILRGRVERIDPKQKTAYADGQAICYEKLINTAPFNRFADWCGLEIEKNVLSSNQVLVLNLGFDRKTEIRDIHWIYFPSDRQIFYRAGFYDNILSSDRGSMYIEIGYPADKTLSDRDIHSALDRTLHDLSQTGILRGQKLVAWEALTINPAYVHITERGAATVSCELERLSQYGIYCIGRYGRWTYCSMEDCILQARDLAHRIGEGKQ